MNIGFSNTWKSSMKCKEVTRYSLVDIDSAEKEGNQHYITYGHCICYSFSSIAH